MSTSQQPVNLLMQWKHFIKTFLLSLKTNQSYSASSMKWKKLSRENRALRSNSRKIEIKSVQIKYFKRVVKRSKNTISEQKTVLKQTGTKIEELVILYIFKVWYSLDCADDYSIYRHVDHAHGRGLAANLSLWDLSEYIYSKFCQNEHYQK